MNDRDAASVVERHKAEYDAPTAAYMRRFRRARFNALRWLLSKTHTGRAVLWNEWLNGQDFARKVDESWKASNEIGADRG